MRPSIHFIVRLVTCASFSLTSCQHIGPAPEDMQKAVGGGALIGGIAGYATGKNQKDRQQGAVAGAAIGGVAGALISATYKATLTQQRQARSRAQMAMKNRSIMKSVEATGTKYVAVPVTPKEGASNGKKQYMKVNVKTGEPEDTVYTNKEGKSGETVRLGMSSAVVYNP